MIHPSITLWPGQPGPYFVLLSSYLRRREILSSKVQTKKVLSCSMIRLSIWLEQIMFAIWKSSKMDENGWKWMKMDENGWKWMKIDENWWKLAINFLQRRSWPGCDVVVQPHHHLPRNILVLGRVSRRRERHQSKSFSNFEVTFLTNSHTSSSS